MIFTHNATTLPRPAVDDVTIREATPTDDVALDRLAQLDSARVPEGRVIVAGANGGLLAAMPVAGGAAIADPFRPTAAIVGLLDLRASQLRGADGGLRTGLCAWRRRFARAAGAGQAPTRPASVLAIT